MGEVGSWGGGSVDDDPAEEDDDFEAELEAVDVSFALADVSLGSKALVSDSIRAATALRQELYTGVYKLKHQVFYKIFKFFSLISSIDFDTFISFASITTPINFLEIPVFFDFF